MTVAEIFERHLTSELSQFRGAFQFLEEITQAGEMPDAADPVVRGYVTQLEQYLASQGLHEADDFLLRFALVAPGAGRGIHPPISVLASERGGFSERRLKEAANQVCRMRDGLALGRQFFSDLSPDTAIALQELSGRSSLPAMSDEQWVAMHAALSPTDAAELTIRGFKCIDHAAKSMRDVGISLLQILADCRRDGLGAATGWLVERKIFYPGSLYRGAPNEIASRLVQELPIPNRLRLNHLLLALAWTRGEVAEKSFSEWQRVPPEWASQLHVPPERYLHNAGWALNKEGRRCDLISLSCHLILKKPAAADASLAIPCRVPAPGKCPGCRAEFSWLFDFSALPSRSSFADLEGAPRKVLCCLNCACFSPIFSRYRSDGNAEWHPATVSREPAPTGDWLSCHCQLSPTPFPPFAAANPFRLDDPSSLGGIPMWLQNSEYPHCPDCTNPMRFLAQFCNLGMPKPEEGIFYSFFCVDCQVAAVTYQQT